MARFSSSAPSPPPTVDWRRLADGRPRRLKRGRHFDAEVSDLVEDAHRVARELGLAVRTYADKRDPDKYVWFQFARAEIGRGEPCPCGGTRLRRVHLHFLACDDCGARLILRDSAAPPREQQVEETLLEEALLAEEAAAFEEALTEEARANERRDHERREARRIARKVARSASLSTYRDVHLSKQEVAGLDAYVGFGVDPIGRDVLLVVSVLHENGAPIPDPASPLGYAHRVERWPVWRFPDAVDTAALRSRDWEIHLP